MMFVKYSHSAILQNSTSGGINNNKKIYSQHKEAGSSTNKVLGYSIDKDGYFSEEFNKAAGIPSDYKIHSSTMQSLVKVSTSSNVFYPASYSSIDIAKSVGNAYKIVSQLLEKSPELAFKESFSKEDLANYFPQTYIVNNNNEVTDVFDYEQTQYAKDNNLFELKNSYLASSFSLGGNLNKAFNPDILHSNGVNGEENLFVKTFDTTADKYTNSDGSITKGGLLIGFLSNNQMLNSNETLIVGKTTIFGKARGLDNSLSQIEIQNLSNFLSDNIFIIDNFNAKEYEALLNNPNISIEKFKSEYLRLRKDSLQRFSENGNSLEDFMREVENSPQFKAIKYLLGLEDRNNNTNKNQETKQWVLDLEV